MDRTTVRGNRYHDCVRVHKNGLMEWVGCGHIDGGIAVCAGLFRTFSSFKFALINDN